VFSDPLGGPITHLEPADRDRPVRDAISVLPWLAPDRLKRTAIELPASESKATLRAMRSLLFGAALGLALAACSDGSRGDGRVGEACQEADDCRHGLCVGGVAGDAPVCTVSCASTDECPRGWACSGLTGDNVLVCTQGAPTPFGVGAREE